MVASYTNESALASGTHEDVEQKVAWILREGFDVRGGWVALQSSARTADAGYWPIHRSRPSRDSAQTGVGADHSWSDVPGERHGSPGPRM
jgi:hypothetical protein